MTTFTTTGASSHSTSLTGLANGTSYTRYVKCKDTAGNISADSIVSFSVASAGGGGTTFTMGETNAGSAASDSGNGNLLLVQDVTLTQAGTLQSLSFRVYTADGQLRLGVYDANGREWRPGQSPGARPTNSLRLSGWNTQNVITPVALQPGTYWLAYHPSSSQLNFYYQGGGTHRYYSRTFGAMPATFSTSHSYRPRPLVTLRDPWGQLRRGRSLQGAVAAMNDGPDCAHLQIDAAVEIAGIRWLFIFEQR